MLQFAGPRLVAGTALFENVRRQRLPALPAAGLEDVFLLLMVVGDEVRGICFDRGWRRMDPGWIGTRSRIAVERDGRRMFMKLSLGGVAIVEHDHWRGAGSSELKTFSRGPWPIFSR